MEDGRKTLKGRARSVESEAASAAPDETEAAPAVQAEDVAARPVATPAAAVVAVVAEVAPDVGLAPEPAWPAAVTITNHSRITIVEQSTGALISPASSRVVTLQSQPHARQVIANIKAILRINHISAAEVSFDGLPSGV